jgi:hypothetical protein
MTVPPIWLQGADVAIMADPRWPALRAQLARTAAVAGCDWDRSLAGWMVWMPQDCRTLVWNSGDQDRAIPNFMGLASLAQEIGIVPAMSYVAFSH